MSDRAVELHNEGDALYGAGDLEGALASYLSAAALAPDRAPLHFNAGNLYRLLGKFAEAISCYDAATALRPDFAMARHNRALCWLQLGDLVTGFREYEWRKACPGFDDPRYRLERPWRGEPLNGKTLFIYPELFQGDLMQFGRYAVLAERQGARVLLGAPRHMHALLRTMSATIDLIAEDETPSGWDFQCALMSLPAAFGTTVATIPRARSYFRADPARVARWADRIGPEGFRIGVAWQGSPLAAQRSFPLAGLHGLSQIPGVRLISLQKHAGLDQLDRLPAGMRVETLGDDFDPGPDAFQDTAAAMMSCDLFITPDTSVVHLAGALGRPAWVALPHISDWRWLHDRADSPWYPSARLFRQTARDDWPSAFAQIEAAVRVLAA
jgi:hypothetical protein